MSEPPWRPCCGACRAEEIDPSSLICGACGKEWDGSEVGQARLELERRIELVRTEGQFQHRGHPPAPGILQPDEVFGGTLDPAELGGFGEPGELLGPDMSEPIDCPFDWMPSILGPALRSGMVQAICAECGRPWLTRPKVEEFASRSKKLHAILFMQLPTPPKLCPLCDPDHIAYEPGGPADRERWFNTWRGQLLQVLAHRARPAILLVERSVWVEDVPLALYECEPRTGGEIVRWHSHRLGNLPMSNFSPRRMTFAAGARLTGWFPAGDSICAIMVPTVEEKPHRGLRYVVPFNPRPVLR
jgi:hypothetical protein